MRVENWESKLNAYIEENKDKAFKYGTWDCCIFTAGAVQIVTGFNHITEFKYKTKKTAEKLLKEGGGIEAILDSKFDRKSIPCMAKRGDIILYNKAIGVCVGNKAIFLNEEGYATVPMKDWEVTWGVE
jgi:hypothetical protein